MTERPPADVERRLAAIMFTDIVGYTVLMAKSEEKGLRARERHRTVLGPLAEGHRGQIIDESGDELVLSFPSALDAVNCALAVQAQLREDPELQLRIGVHLGDVVFEEGRVYGDGVNVASRIRPLAEPGGICVSDEVQHSVQNQENIETRSLGEHKLKNVPRAVEVFAVGRPGALATRRPRVRRDSRPWQYAAAACAVVVLVAFAWWGWNRPVAAPGPIRSIAVLPLENLSGDPGQDYFVGGMHEALISSLARIGMDLRVISRTSAIQIDREGKTIPEIAAQLGVDGVIEGSAMREGDQVRVTVQLIDARRDDHLWAQSYDREFSSALALTREISRSVAGQIRLVLSPEREQLLADTHTIDPRALDLYLSGVQHLSRVTLPDARRAIQLFESSIAADPNFARAHEGLARSYWYLLGKLWAISAEEALPKVREAASRAIELDGTLAQAHAVLARARWITTFDWVQTEASLLRALALEPMNVHVIEAFSSFLTYSGRIEEGLALIKRAVAADPLNSSTRTGFGWHLYYARRFQDALEEAKLVLERDPGFARAHELLASAHYALGDLEAAHRGWRKSYELWGRPAWFLEAVDRGYAQGGLSGGQRELLAAIRERDDGSISHTVRAIIACLANEREEALVELNRALRKPDPKLIHIGKWPTLECVQSDPRFQDLLRKINWPGLEG